MADRLVSAADLVTALRTRKTPAELLEFAGLSSRADTRIQTLSGGMKRRVMIAKALVHEPRVLFLDEPTSGVDPLARREFWDLVHLLARRSRITVLVSTHYMDEAEHCDRLGLMHQGRLIAVGAPSELRTRAEQEGGPVVAVDAHDFAAAYPALRDAFPAAMLYGRRIQWQTATADADAARAQALLSEAQLDGHLRRLGLSMEEAFVHFVSRAGANHG